MSLVMRVVAVGFAALAAWQCAAGQQAAAQTNPALFGPANVTTMMPPQRTMPFGPFGVYDLFSVYVPSGLYARQPLGHEIIRTSANGYIYRPVFDPPQVSVQAGFMQPNTVPAGPIVSAPSAAAPLAPGQPNALPPGSIPGNGLSGNGPLLPGAFNPLQAGQFQGPPLQSAPSQGPLLQAPAFQGQQFQGPQFNAPPAGPEAAVMSVTPEMHRLLNLAENAFRAGRYDEALNQVQTLLDASPNLGLAALLHAETLFALGKYPESAVATRWALTNLPRKQWGLIVENVRHFYAQPEKYTDQLRSLEAYVRQNPTAAAGHFLLGYHYGYMGRQAEAAQQLAAASELFQVDEQSRLLGQMFQDPNNPRTVVGRPEAPGPANPIPAPRGPQEF